MSDSNDTTKIVTAKELQHVFTFAASLIIGGILAALFSPLLPVILGLVLIALLYVYLYNHGDEIDDIDNL